MTRTERIKQVIELQRKIDRARRRHGLDAWMALSLTVPQLKTLFFISNNGSANSRHLAQALHVTPPNMTGIIDRLVSHGLLLRSEDSRDRRSLLLQTTGKGEELISNLREIRTDYFSRVLARLNEDELDEVVRGLGMVVNATEVYEKESGDEHDRS